MSLRSNEYIRAQYGLMNWCVLSGKGRRICGAFLSDREKSWTPFHFSNRIISDYLCCDSDTGKRSSHAGSEYSLASILKNTQGVIKCEFSTFSYAQWAKVAAKRLRTLRIITFRSSITCLSIEHRNDSLQNAVIVKRSTYLLWR